MNPFKKNTTIRIEKEVIGECPFCSYESRGAKAVKAKKIEYEVTKNGGICNGVQVAVEYVCSDGRVCMMPKIYEMLEKIMREVE